MVSLDALRQGTSAVAVVGLGYVGLPLAVALARHFDVIGFDVNSARVEALRQGHDATREVDGAELAACKALFTDDPEQLRRAAVIIVAVPTPVDDHRRPDLSPVRAASRTVGRHMSRGCVVCYESTVYPGVTEEECRPILEAESGLRFPQDFTLGYSPERINPGDKVHRLETIRKIVSGSDEPTADLLAQKGVAADCYKLVQIYPLPQGLCEALQPYGTILFAEEAVRTGGIGEQLAFALQQNGWQGRYRLHAVDNTHLLHANVPQLRRDQALDAAALAQDILKNRKAVNA